MKREPLYDFSTALAAPPPMVTPSATRRYALSILMVLLATVVTLVLWPLFERSNVLLLGVAIMASTWYGGFGPGLLAAMLSAALSAYLLVGPLYPLPIAVREDVLRLVVFVAIAGLTSLLAEVRIRSERTLREQWGFCRVTLTSIGDAVIVTNAAGHVTFMNDMAQSLTGWTLEDAFRRPLAEIFQIVNERTRQAVESPVSKVAREGVVVGLANHTVLIAKDRTERPIDDSGAPIRDRGGAVVGVVLVFRDVSERKRGEEERARLFQLEQSARAQAEAANRSKDEFLATISHELRTPLTAILGWIRLVRTMPLDPAMSSRGLETIERNAKAQAQLIDDLLDMSRIVSGRMQLDVRPVELVSVVHAALDSVRPAAEAKGIRLVENLDPTAGPVLGDATRLQQVVWNLLSNAIKFTPKAGRVEIRLERADSNVVITVRDTGQGIAPDVLPHLFERFSQAESRGARTAGLGLGLAIVRHLVELHGGTVVAESGGTDRGATFRVTLPLRAVFARPRDAEDVVPAESARPVPDLTGVRVVIVEDNEDAQQLLRTILERCGATVRLVASAEPALQVIATERPDVILSDIGMPGDDGYALMRRVRMLPPDQGGRIPAAALTAYASKADAARALAEGFQTHIAKPVEPLLLMVVIARLAGREFRA